MYCTNSTVEDYKLVLFCILVQSSMSEVFVLYITQYLELKKYSNPLPLMLKFPWYLNALCVGHLMMSSIVSNL